MRDYTSDEPVLNASLEKRSLHSPLAQEEKAVQGARVRQILKKCGSLKEAVVIHELLKRPYP